MSPSLYLGATGFGLIAVCYGFARFAFGLFLPQIDADLSLSPTLSGLISGGSFLGYCIAIVLAAYLTERIGARAVAVGAALIAAVGMIGIAIASSTLWLAIAVMIAGSSTGLASPLWPLLSPLPFDLIGKVLPTRSLTPGQAQAWCFPAGGTSAGRSMAISFAGFAVAAFVMAVAAAVSVPGENRAAPKTAGGLPPLNTVIVRLIAASFVMGASSTALWTFGGKLVNLQLGWSNTGAGLLWIAIGAAGIVGAGAGTLVARFGIDRVHWFFLGTMALGILLVGTSATTPF